MKLTLEDLRRDGIIVLDDPWRPPITKRQKWKVRRWLFRWKMRLRTQDDSWLR